MDPFSLIFIILAIYGGMHAVKNGVKVGRASAALSRVNAAGKAPKNASRQIMADTRRRATAGWWLREIGNGFPVTLGGIRQGWAAHNEAHAEHAANTTEKRATVAERIADHKARMEAAQARLDAARPAVPVQAPPPPGHPVMAPPVQAPASQTASNQADSNDCTDPDCEICNPTAGQPAAGNPASVNDPATWKDDPMATCSDPACPYCHTKTSGSNGSSGQPTGSPSASQNGAPSVATASDTTFDSAIATCQQVQSRVDQMVNDPVLTQAIQLADSLGPMFPDDQESLGVAGDLVTALNKVKTAQQEAIEQAQLLEQTIRKNHQAAHEAAQGTGHMAEREFHTTS